MKKALFLGLMLAFLAGSGLAFASTNIDNCTTLDTPGEYLVTTNISEISGGGCINITSNDTILNCQGYLINNTLDTESTSNAILFNTGGPFLSNITIKNCILRAYGSVISGEKVKDSFITSNDVGYSGYGGIRIINVNNSYFFNNTITNNIDNGGLTLETLLFDNMIENNTISYNSGIGEGVILLPSDFGFSGNNTIKNNTISSNGKGIYSFYALENASIYGNIIALNNIGIDSEEGTYSIIYNNLMNNTLDIFLFDDNETYPNYWNTTLQTGTRIYSSGTQIGGNYWTNSTGTGYSDTCTDLLQDGFCDDPYDVGAGVACAAVADGLPACGNNTDWLPLSAFYEEPPCVQNWTCTEWGECVRGYQTRICTDENECGNKTGEPAEIQLCLTPVPNATMNITQACCPISTLRCYDNSTLMEIWNTSAGVAYAFEDCPFGCDNSTLSCAPKKFEQNLYLLGIFIFIVVAGLIAIKWAKR